MKTLIKSEQQLNTSRINIRDFQSKEKDQIAISVIDYKFYQKLFLVLICFSTILIFPENPKQLETICLNHHTKQICNVW